MDPPHMAEQKQGEQLEPTFSSYVRIRDVVLKTYLGRWTIGRSGERRSGISVLAARQDDDDASHHHHIALVARISLILSRHSSLSFIALGRSSGQHPVSSHSCWMYVRAGCPAFARPCVGVHKSTSLMSSSLLLQQYPACLVRLTWIVFVIGGRWPYSWCLVGCCRQDLFILIYILLTADSKTNCQFLFLQQLTCLCKTRFTRFDLWIEHQQLRTQSF